MILKLTCTTDLNIKTMYLDMVATLLIYIAKYLKRGFAKELNLKTKRKSLKILHLKYNKYSEKLVLLPVKNLWVK